MSGRQHRVTWWMFTWKCIAFVFIYHWPATLNCLHVTSLKWFIFIQRCSFLLLRVLTLFCPFPAWQLYCAFWAYCERTWIYIYTFVSVHFTPTFLDTCVMQHVPFIQWIFLYPSLSLYLYKICFGINKDYMNSFELHCCVCLWNL